MKKSKLVKRIFGWIGGILLAIILVLFIGVFAIWHNEISTVSSMKMIVDRNDDHKDGVVYTMNVKGDYYFDEFVEMGGVQNDKELLSFIIYSS